MAKKAIKINKANPSRHGHQICSEGLEFEEMPLEQMELEPFTEENFKQELGEEVETTVSNRDHNGTTKEGDAAISLEKSIRSKSGKKKSS